MRMSKHLPGYKWTWTPQPDITAYELALCMFITAPMTQESLARHIEKLPKDCQRHFTRTVVQ